MRQAVLVSVSALLMALLLPVLCLTPAETVKKDLMLVIEETRTLEDEMIVRLGGNNGIIEIPLESYLVGVVLSELPGTFEMEAMKAQAVAARTFTLRQKNTGKHTEYDLCVNSSCCQAWSDKKSLEASLGNDFDNFWNKAQWAVEETRGEVLLYDDMLIDAVYFSCSGGVTEDAVAVWGTEIPYLKSVISTGEEESSAFESEMTISCERFREILYQENSSVAFDEDPSKWLGSIQRTKGGGVENIEIGGQLFAGTKFRTLFGLNSTRFSVEIGESTVCFRVMGYGHRVGLSQYGANAMAKAGFEYKDILLHYYSGVEVEKWETLQDNRTQMDKKS